ncbi:hypothetical protein ABPG75_009452 [Micractinium tetrahymenae]
MPVSIESLPDAVLGRILGLRVEVVDLVRTEGGGLAQWDLDAGGGWLPLSSLLALLAPGQLQAPSVGCTMRISPDALQQALRFTRLQQLSLSAPVLPDNTATALAQLPQLRSLSLRSLQLPASAVQAAARCSGLTSLHLATFLLVLPPLHQLSALSALVHLGLKEDTCEIESLEQLVAEHSGQHSPMQPPQPAAFPALQTYSFGSVRRPLHVGWATLTSCDYELEVGEAPAGWQSFGHGGLTALILSANALTSLPASIAAATSLHTLDVEGNPVLLLKPKDIPLLTGLPSLRKLAIGMQDSEAPARVLRALRRAVPLLHLE